MKATPVDAPRSPSVLQTTLGVVQEVISAARSIMTPAVGGVPTETLGDFAELIRLQIDVQKEMQTVTMVSNIEKSKHESKMAALRNVRVS